MNNIDFIGDIHGHAEKLEYLLSKLGYEKRNGSYRHSERTIIFVGDYIDRGPDNPKTIQLVRKMVDAGTAIALCGNHEYNAICFNTKGPDGYLRPHTIKNIKQHAETLFQFHGRQNEYDDAIKWFKTLPLYYETPTFRAVNASWDDKSIGYLQEHLTDGIISEEAYPLSTDKQSPLFHAVETTCKGKEMALPKGVSFLDKDGTERFDIRVKWWLNPQGRTFTEMSVVEGLKMEDTGYKDAELKYYREHEKPVFFGHYWLNGYPTYTGEMCVVWITV